MKLSKSSYKEKRYNLPSIQDTTYPRIKSNLTVKELDEVYTPQRTEIAWTEAKC